MVLYQENFKLVVNEFQGKAMDLSIGRAKLELLRKGCCHPQVFDKSLKSKGNMSQAGPRPLNEIMVMKVEQAKLSCEESQREQLFYLLTMAGIRLLQYQRLAVQDHNYPHEQDTVIKNPNQLIFLLSAMKIYKYTLSLILAGRMSTSLIAMAQVQGDHLQHSNTNMAINEHVHFEWSHSISNNSVSDNCKSMSREQEGIWQSLQVLLEEDIQLPTQCLQMVGSNGLQSSYEVKLHFMHHKSIVSLNVINSNLSFDRIASDFKKLQDTNENYREIVYVFPAEATLSAAVNGADMYLNTMKINFPFPGHSLENINSESLQKNVHKSKSWRLQISKFYDFVLVVRRTGDSLNQFDYKWQQGIPVDHSSQVMNNSQIMLQASISMYESAVETDSLQELHVCYNFRETLQMLTSIYSHHQAVFDYISKHVNIPKDVYHLRDIDQIEPSQDLFEIEIEMSKPVVEVQPLSIKKSMTMDYNLFTPLKYARQMFDIGKKKASNVHFDHEVELVDGTNADHVVLPMGDCQELRAEIYRQVLSIEDQVSLNDM